MCLSQPAEQFRRNSAGILNLAVQDLTWRHKGRKHLLYFVQHLQKIKLCLTAKRSLLLSWGMKLAKINATRCILLIRGTYIKKEHCLRSPVFSFHTEAWKSCPSAQRPFGEGLSSGAQGHVWMSASSFWNFLAGSSCFAMPILHHLISDFEMTSNYI